jgi:hypothetical protein
MEAGNNDDHSYTFIPIHCRIIIVIIVIAIVHDDDDDISTVILFILFNALELLMTL